MFTAEDIAEAVASAYYLDDEGHGAPSQADLDQWRDVALSQGLRAMVEKMRASPAGSARRNLIDQLVLDYAAGKLGGSAPVAHDHDLPGGTTGPAKPIT